MRAEFKALSSLRCASALQSSLKYFVDLAGEFTGSRFVARLGASHASLLCRDSAAPNRRSCAAFSATR